MAKRRKGPTLIQSSRRVPADVKAMYHHLGRVKRPFLGLTDAEARQIETLLGNRIEVRLGTQS